MWPRSSNHRRTVRAQPCSTRTREELDLVDGSTRDAEVIEAADKAGIGSAPSRSSRFHRWAMLRARCSRHARVRSPSPDPTILYSSGVVGMSGGNWDLPADVGVTVHAYSYARRPTTLTLTSATLYPPNDPGTPLATLSLAVMDPQLDFAGVDDEYVSLANSGTLNRTLAPACGPVRVVLVFHSSSCGCDVRVEGNGAVGCYADNGADPELAATGAPAPAGKPCGARF